jgi:hypothetical protein
MATVFFLMVSSWALRSSAHGVAHAGHTRGVGHREVVAVADGRQGEDLDLPADVHGEGAVLPVEQLDAVGRERADGVEHDLLVRLGGAVDDHVLVEVGQLRLEPLEPGDVAPGVAYHHRELAQHARAVLQADANADRKGGGRGVGHPNDVTGARTGTQTHWRGPGHRRGAAPTRVLRARGAGDRSEAVGSGANRPRGR